MTSWFVKQIPLNLGEVDLSRIKGEFLETYDGSFKTYSIKDPQYLKELEDKHIHFGIPADLNVYTEVEAEGTWPHSDNCATALNYYVKADEARLWWFEETTASSETILSSSKDSTSYKFALENLKPLGFVEPKDNEGWLLNTKKIHMVEKLNPDAPRFMIRWIWWNVRPDLVLKRMTFKNT